MGNESERSSKNMSLKYRTYHRWNNLSYSLIKLRNHTQRINTSRWVKIQKQPWGRKVRELHTHWGKHVWRVTIELLAALLSIELRAQTRGLIGGSPLGPLGAWMEDHTPKMKLFGISHHSCENEKFIRVFLVWSLGEAMTSSNTLCTSLWPDKECSYRSSPRVLLQARKTVRLASYALW